MKPAFSLWPLALVLAIGACATRVPLYAPRRTPTPAHIQAANAADCLGCHRADLLRNHRADDACLECHPLCEGC